jgi:hypothetical protein
VAGKVQQAIWVWQQLTTDRSILNVVCGYKLKFDSDCLPVQSSTPRPIKFSTAELLVLDGELQKLLNKHVIEAAHSCFGQFISNLFFRPKKDGSVRVILNLKYLNEYMEYHRFKMDTLRSATKLIRPQCYFASIDLKDAYYSVPVCDSDRKFLRFNWQGQLYQFTCLAQGLLPAPRIFTKIMKPVFSHLRKLGHTILGYIDDSIIIADSSEECRRAIHDSLQLMDSLGLTVHPDKSVVHPTQEKLNS